MHPSEMLLCRCFTLLIWNTSWTTKCVKQESFADLTKHPHDVVISFELNLKEVSWSEILNVNKFEKDLNEIVICGGPAVSLESAKLCFCSCFGNHVICQIAFRKEF